jgi:hypothetical protein
MFNLVVIWRENTGKYNVICYFTHYCEQAKIVNVLLTGYFSTDANIE